MAAAKIAWNQLPQAMASAAPERKPWTLFRTVMNRLVSVASSMKAMGI